jgi:hypothetical protein
LDIFSGGAYTKHAGMELVSMELMNMDLLAVTCSGAAAV